MAIDIFEDTDSLPEEASHIERTMTRRREIAVGAIENERPLLLTDNLQQATTFFAAKEW